MERMKIVKRGLRLLSLGNCWLGRQRFYCIFSDTIRSPGMGREGEDKNSEERPHRLLSLEKQLNIELKVIMVGKCSSNFTFKRLLNVIMETKQLTPSEVEADQHLCFNSFQLFSC